MASLALGVKFNPAAGGLTDFAYSSVVLGYVGPAATSPAMVDGKTYRYRAESADLSQWEFGSGVYTAASQTIARTTITLSSTGAKVSFTAPPQVGVVAFPADLASSEFTQTGTGAVLRTVDSKLKEWKSITDFGCVGDGATDNATNLQAAITAAGAGNFGLYVPSGSFVCNSSVAMPAASRICMRGDGPLVSLFQTNVNGPLFSWAVTGTIEGSAFDGIGFSNTIATAGVYSSSCVFGISGNNTSFFQYNRFTDLDAYSFNSFFKVTKATVTTGFGQESPVAHNFFDRIRIQQGNNHAVYGWLYTLGSGTENNYSNCKVGVDTAMIFYQGSGCVVGDIRVVNCSIASLGTCAIVKIDAGTVYNQRILVTGCQPDSGAAYPLSLDSTGSHDYNNITIEANNLGGGVDLYTVIPPIRNSRVSHVDVGEWRVGNFKTSAVVGAISTDVFLVDLGGVLNGSPSAFGGTYVEMTVSGLVGGVNGGVILKRYAVQLSTTASVTVIESTGKPVPGAGFFDVTTTLSGTTIKFTVTCTSSATGTVIDAQLRTMGGGVRVQRL